MRKVILSCLIALLALNGLSGVALADGMILPETLNSQYLVVRYHHVTVTIDDNHVITRVEQEFYNPQSFTVNGRYLFPVPPEAILSNFQATIYGQAQSFSRQDAITTNTELFNAVAQRRDPSLLQYVDWETIAFNLTLTPGSTRRMSLEYEQVLAPSGGMLHYRYILGTERYTSQPLENVSIRVDLKSSGGISSLYSPSHQVNTERMSNTQARVTWQAQNVQPTEDFDLFFAPSEGGFGGGLMTGQREGQDHYLFIFAPETQTADRTSLPKDIVFAIDRSGSMSGGKLEQAQNALHYILDNLNEGDRFSIVGFDDEMLSLSASLLSVDSASLDQARQFVNVLAPRGSTDLAQALQTGLRIFTASEARSNAVRLVVFLTDGLPTAGETNENAINELAAGANRDVAARLHVFGVGYDVNTHLLDRLADDNGGSVTYVQPGEDLELALSSFYQQIASPVLTNVQVDFEGLQVEEQFPQHLPDLFRGSSLLLTGRYHAASPDVTVHVRGQVGDQSREYVYHYNLDQTGGHDFVPRLWATRKVGALLDRVRVEGSSPALTEEIQGLGLGYGIATPYTLNAITAQTDGLVSRGYMDLYSDSVNLNQVSGQTSVQARVQNQYYQGARQANAATGANVLNRGRYSLAQLSNQNIDLGLLKGKVATNTAVDGAWIAQNIKADRQIAFGSDEYFALAKDPEARQFLQSGTNVIFKHQGQVITVQDTGAAATPSTTHQSTITAGEIFAFVQQVIQVLFH
jgi:Ca-activated chloride channel family protein